MQITQIGTGETTFIGLKNRPQPIILSVDGKPFCFGYLIFLVKDKWLFWPNTMAGSGDHIISIQIDCYDGLELIEGYEPVKVESVHSEEI